MKGGRLEEIWCGQLLVCLLCAMLCIAAGCRLQDHIPAARSGFEVQKEFGAGPVRFEQKLNRKEITIAERVSLVLEVSAPEEYEITFPEFGAKLDEFGIVDYSTSPSRLGEGGRLIRERSYLLEPFLSGEYTIPPMTVSYRTRDGDESHDISSEELKVSVKSLLPDAGGDLKIKEIGAPLGMPFSITWGWAVLLLLVLGLAAAAAYWFWRRRAKTTQSAEVVLPHEAAYRALSRLLEQKLVEQGLVREFYQALSDILRRYIEDRFGLRAPERTTEEFMVELTQADILAAGHKRLLKDFLRHCDMVKFAKYSPQEPEIDGAVKACRSFVAETEPGLDALA